MAVSIDQAVRRLRHGQYRPDLIICDDIEDLDSVKTLEGRDKTYRWVKGELLPAGDTNTTTVLSVTLLTRTVCSKVCNRRLRVEATDCTYREYPLIDLEGRCAMAGQIQKNAAAVESERKRVSDASALASRISAPHPARSQAAHSPAVDQVLRQPSLGRWQSSAACCHRHHLAISKPMTAPITRPWSLGWSTDMEGYADLHASEPCERTATFLETIDRWVLPIPSPERPSDSAARQDVGYQHAHRTGNAMACM